jgi:hypothetical protein
MDFQHNDQRSRSSPYSKRLGNSYWYGGMSMKLLLDGECIDHSFAREFVGYEVKTGHRWDGREIKTVNCYPCRSRFDVFITVDAQRRFKLESAAV